VFGVVAVWQAGNWSAWLADLPGVLHLNALIPSSFPESGILWIIVPVLTTIALLSGIVVYIASEKQ